MMNSPPPLAVHLLGGFSVLVAGRAVPTSAWQQRRAAAVVKLLALQPQRRVHREVLMETLWPELTGAPAANNLRVAMHRARQRLESAGAPAGRFLTRDGDDVVLGEPADVWVDVDEFTQAVQHAWLLDDPSAAQAAVNHYAGDLLPENPYDDWAAQRRTDLRVSYVALLARLAQKQEARGDCRAAIIALQRLLVADPLDEAAHVSLMRLYAAIGATQQALAQYQTLTSLLAQELDTPPDASTTALYTEIEQQARAGADQALLAPPTPSPEAGGTPFHDTAALEPAPDLIGRERELAELARLLERHRLVTLVGPAGVGKTRLAEAALRAEQARGRDGRLIDLAAVSEPALLVSTIAEALGATTPETDTTWKTLMAHIGTSSLMLVLDNFEQLTPAAAAVADLLRACPRLVLLVTTRERLRLRAEHVYPVAPLAVPNATTASATLDEYPAVSLFLLRAEEADPGFSRTTTELGVVAEICRLLDGLPLAIELAAARVRLLPPPALLAHLAHPLAVLTGGPRDAPARQQTMRAAIAWSVKLLAPDSRVLFQRLACFPDRFSLPAVREVTALEMADPNVPEMEVSGALLDVVEDLLDKHLLRRVDAGSDAPRFAMLTVIREFAIEQLAVSPDAPLVRDRHAGYYEALAGKLGPLLVTADASIALVALDQDLSNLRTALTTRLHQGRVESALRLTSSLWRYWLVRGLLSEGRTWLARVLAAAEGTESAEYAAALDADGVLAFAQSEFAAARLRHNDALTLARRIGDTALAARALANLGTVADEQGLPVEAARYLEEALVASRAAGDERVVAVVLANLGQAAMSLADYPRAAALLHESTLAFRQLGDHRSEAAMLANLGLMSLMVGDPATAQRCHAEALRVFRELGDAPAEAAELLNLGHATQHLGNLGEAESLFRDAFARFAELGDRSGQALTEVHLGKLALLRAEHDLAEELLQRALHTSEDLGDWTTVTEATEGLAMLLSETGAPLPAAQALGTAEAMREALGIPLPAIHQRAMATCLQLLEEELTPAALAAARMQGRKHVRQRFPALPGEERVALVPGLPAGLDGVPE